MPTLTFIPQIDLDATPPPPEPTDICYPPVCSCALPACDGGTGGGGGGGPDA